MAATRHGKTNVQSRTVCACARIDISLRLVPDLVKQAVNIPTMAASGIRWVPFPNPMLLMRTSFCKDVLSQLMAGVSLASPSRSCRSPAYLGYRSTHYPSSRTYFFFLSRAHIVHSCSSVTAPLALAAGASGVGVGSAVNKLNSDVAMLAAVRQVCLVPVQEMISGPFSQRGSCLSHNLQLQMVAGRLTATTLLSSISCRCALTMARTHFCAAPAHSPPADHGGYVQGAAARPCLTQITDPHGRGRGFDRGARVLVDNLLQHGEERAHLIGLVRGTAKGDSPRASHLR